MKVASIVLGASFLLLIIACEKNSSGDPISIGNWVKRAHFDGPARTQACSMVIGDTAYVGTGVDTLNYMNDFWRYDPVTNTWSQRASLPAVARAGSVAASVNKKGYILTGWNGRSQTLFKDNWEYTPSSNSWNRKSDFIGTPRYAAVAFSLNDKIYVATGWDGNETADFFVYNAAADTAGAVSSPWQKLFDFPGTKRRGAVAFVYSGKGYICTGGAGVGSTFTPATDMWEFDAAAGSWAKKRSIFNASPDLYDDQYAIVRMSACAFVLNNRAYISCGVNGKILKDTWEYDLTQDVWTAKCEFEGVARMSAVGFAVRNRGFVTGGDDLQNRFDDLREFFPFDAYNVND